MSCGWQWDVMTMASHGGVTMRLCSDCLDIARELVLVLPDDSPAVVLHVTALAACGIRVEL